MDELERARLKLERIKVFATIESKLTDVKDLTPEAIIVQQTRVNSANVLLKILDGKI